MAIPTSGPLTLRGYVDGKPVFDPPIARPTASAAATVPAPADHAPAARQKSPNLYPGRCSRCGNTVGAEQGFRGDKVNGRWTVEHRPGDTACQTGSKNDVPPERAEPAAATVNGSGRGPVCTPDGKEPWAGYFTAQLGDQTDYVTLRVRRQKKDARFQPGRLIVSRLTGPDNEGDYTAVAHVDEKGRCWIWKKHQEPRLRRAIAAVLGDQEAAGKAWARESRCCWRCHQRLTTPSSLDQLQGDICYGKYVKGVRDNELVEENG